MSENSAYEITIGIECHVQLATKTKLFSEVDNDARGKEPNSCVSPVEYALPGMLPRLNQEAVRLATRAGLALNSNINLISRFDRKHYFYPDSPKGYQITQMYQPIIGPGFVELPNGTKIRIEHAHLEGDAGKLTHFDTYSLVDLNRADTPLIEIVSMPDIHSKEDARDYCKELWRILTFAGVTYGDLYNGNMRFDVNISLAKKGSPELGTRAEIKNLNSFRSVEMAGEQGGFMCGGGGGGVRRRSRWRRLKWRSITNITGRKNCSIMAKKSFRKLVVGMIIPAKLLHSAVRKKLMIIATCQSQIFHQFI